MNLGKVQLTLTIQFFDFAYQHNPRPDRDRLKSLSTYRKFNTDILNPCTHVKYDYSQNKHV